MTAAHYDNPRAWLDTLTADQLDEYAIAARRRALEVEEEGLAGLVPVDRILATVGGLVGGTLTVVAALGWAAVKDARATRVRLRRGRP